MQPARQCSVRVQTAPFARQEQERGLEGVFRRSSFPKNVSARPQDQRPIAANNFSKGLFIPGGQVTPQQLPIGQSVPGERVKETKRNWTIGGWHGLTPEPIVSRRIMATAAISARGKSVTG
jgi:hypothetical protein